MAKKSKTEEKLNYKAEVKELREYGPERLYFLWGPEDYLREQYVSEIKKICIPEGDESFSYRLIDGAELQFNDFRDAVDALPFMTERSLVEIRDAKLNQLADSDSYIKLFSDIPDYCTVVFVQGVSYEPDGRLKLIKALREKGKELHFTRQSQGALVDWIIRRFAAAGKAVELEAAQRLMFISGELMSGLIPEIEKVAAYTKGERVSVADVEAVANRIPEAIIFDMTDFISQKKYNSAMAVLSELLSDKKQEIIPMLGMLGKQMRQLYVARLAVEKGLDTKFVMESCGMKNEYPARLLLSSARGFTMAQLKRAVEICVETDYMLKSSGISDRELFKDAVLRIAAGESCA